jgi:hypothetical protein
VPNKQAPMLDPPLINENFVDEKAKATFYFDSYLSRQPISPNARNPCLSDARFETINKMPTVCSRFKKA